MPKRLRIGQPTGLWKEEMETGTNDPTILQAGNGRSTTEISVTQALDSLDSLDSPIGFSTCSQFANFQLPSLVIPCYPLQLRCGKGGGHGLHGLSAFLRRFSLPWASWPSDRGIAGDSETICLQGLKHALCW